MEEDNLSSGSNFLLDFPDRDYEFENKELWGVEYADGEYNLSVKLDDSEESLGREEGLKELHSGGIFSFFKRRKKKLEEEGGVSAEEIDKSEELSTSEEVISLTEEATLVGEVYKEESELIHHVEKKEPIEELQIERLGAESIVKDEPEIPQTGEVMGTLAEGLTPQQIATNKKDRTIEKTHRKLALKREAQEKERKKRAKRRGTQASDLIWTFSLESFPEEERLFPDVHPLNRDSKKDFEDQEHQKVLEEHQQVYSEDQSIATTYNLKDFPLAEPELVNKLAERHLTFFNLLTKLQDTHTLEDFKTAYQIQDRVAYLLDNQALLYRGLTKKLIQYLERINQTLKKYYEEITLKQEDIKKINAQISRFNEYDRKTNLRMEEASKETDWLKKDVATYEDSLNLLPLELENTTLKSEGLDNSAVEFQSTAEEAVAASDSDISRESVESEELRAGVNIADSGVEVTELPSRTTEETVLVEPKPSEEISEELKKDEVLEGH